MKMLATALAVALLLPACTATVGPPGPAGPPGAAGPPGPPNDRPANLRIFRPTTGNATIGTIPPDIDVVIIEGRTSVVRLPKASIAGEGRTIITRVINGQGGLVPFQGDRFDVSNDVLNLNDGDMITLMSDGQTRWIIISTSDL